MRRVWPDAFVEEGNLTKNIFFLRKALGPSDEGREYIENRAQREYWFTARVQTLSGEVEGTEVALPTASGTTRRRQRLNESTAEGATRPNPPGRRQRLPQHRRRRSLLPPPTNDRLRAPHGRGAVG